MKSVFGLIFLFLSIHSFGQTGKRVLLHCETLGKQQGSVRYYHPIEGEYLISDYCSLPSNELKKKLKGFTFIRPIDFLQDTLTELYANSLRHYIDPEELIYVNWQMGYDTAFNFAKLDTFKAQAKIIREEKYSQLVHEYFTPFFISKVEISNKEYRDFCFWVVDSMMRESVYLNSNPTGEDEISPEVIAKFLNVPENGKYWDEVNMSWQDFDPSMPFINRGLFPFDWDFDWKKKIPDEQWVPLISHLYLRPNERWYKRRELDVRKFAYRYYERVSNRTDSSGVKTFPWIRHEIDVWPDTTSWYDMKWLPFNGSMGSMYFWHPAYDNYPVVGISWVQAQAYIHWKQRMMEKKFPEIAGRYVLSLPSTKEIEWVALMSANSGAKNMVSDDHIMTDLYLGTRQDPYVGFSELLLSGEGSYTEKVYSAFYYSDAFSKKRFKKLLDKKRGNSKDLEYGSLAADLNQMRYVQNYHAAGVGYLSNNVSEWLEEDYCTHYQELIEAYINFKCFQNVDYCQFERHKDVSDLRRNDEVGKLIMGSNWYDERYETIFGVNKGGIYPKTFQDQDSSYTTVGFRVVLRPTDVNLIDLDPQIW